MQSKLVQKQKKVKNNGIPIIEELLKRLIDKGASDLHLMVQSQPILRINGMQEPQEDMPIWNPDDVDVFPPAQQRQVRLQLSQVLEAVLSQTLLPCIDGGRIAAFEIMLTSSVIKRLIRDEKIWEITPNIEMGVKEGSQSLNQALARSRSEKLSNQRRCYFKKRWSN